MAKILTVDANTHIRSALKSHLQGKGFDVLEANNASSALTSLRKQAADLVVLDDELPDLRGLDVLREIKRNSHFGPVRVVITSSDDDETLLSKAVSWGADDFVVKPYSFAEILARVKLGLKRQPVAAYESDHLVAGKLSIDEISHQAIAAGRALELSPLEYKLLLFFMTNPDRMFTRAELVHRVWNRRASVSERTVDVNVRRLRQQLTPSGCQKYIQTIRANGYRFSVTN